MKGANKNFDEIRLESFRELRKEIEKKKLTYENLLTLTCLLIEELNKQKGNQISLEEWLAIEKGVATSIRKIPAKAGGHGKHKSNNEFLLLMKEDYLKYIKEFPDVNHSNNWHARRLLKKFKPMGCGLKSEENLARKISKWKPNTT